MDRLEEIKERVERVSAFNRHDQFGQFTTEDVSHLLERIEHLQKENERLQRTCDNYANRLGKVKRD